MKTKKTKTEIKKESLEDFLQKHGIMVLLDHIPDQVPIGRYVTVATPEIKVVTSQGTSDQVMHRAGGFGESSTAAINMFLEISGHVITLDNGKTHFTCPHLIWDGILRIPVNTRKL